MGGFGFICDGQDVRVKETVASTVLSDVQEQGKNREGNQGQEEVGQNAADVHWVFRVSGVSEGVRPGSNLVLMFQIPCQLASIAIAVQGIALQGSQHNLFQGRRYCGIDLSR